MKRANTPRKLGLSGIAMAVGELLCRAARERCRQGPISASAVGLIAMTMAPAAWPAPEGAAVSAGQAQVGRAGNLTIVVQQSNRAVIDWRSFNVGATEAVSFRHPDASGVTLNRVLGNDPSTILGRITANGSVFLVNPNGVLFGQGSQVNVGGLVASTANISNANFMAGNYRFDQPGKPGAKVENRGTIRIADTGIAALVGRQVVNAESGFIVATLGKVALAAGDAFVLDLTGDRLVNLILDQSLMEQVRDAQGVPLIARVDNTGNIQASGGRVQLSAGTVSGLLDNVINVGGDIRATAANARNGVISLFGNETTDVTVAGVLQASGAGSSIQAAGRDITVASTAQVDLGLGASLALNAGRDIAFNGTINALREPGTTGAVAGGSITATAGRDLAVHQTLALNDGSLSLSAVNGSLSGAVGSVLQAGNAAITLRGGAGVSANRVLTAGAVDIASTAGGVTVTQAIGAPVAAGALAAPSSALRVDAAGNVALAGATVGAGGMQITSRAGNVGSQPAQGATAGGLVSAGGISIAALGGTAGTTSAPLNVRAAGADGTAGTTGGVSIEGSQGVTVGALVTPGAVLLRSASGDVTATSAIAGASGASLADSNPAQTRELHIEAAGSVTLAGASTGGGGIAVRGASANTGAASFNVAGGSLLSAGDISVTTAGPITTNALVRAGGSVQLTATSGAVTIGAAGLESTGAGRGISVTSGGDLRLNGDVIANNAGISLSSTGGSVTAQVAAAGDNAVVGDALIDAGSSRGASAITVRAQGPINNGGVTLGAVIAGGIVQIRADNGNVALLSPLGGSTTGYDTYENGYQERLRPNVGVLNVSAPNGSIELNGLNLDGISDPTITDISNTNSYGLTVNAGHRIISNRTVAVNRGNILFQAGTAVEGDGVYLGASVYSRGWDFTGIRPDGTPDTRDGTNGASIADEKIGYGIKIAGRRLALFDNNDDIAELPGIFQVTLPSGDKFLTDAQAYVVDGNGIRLTTNGVARRTVAIRDNSPQTNVIGVQIVDDSPSISVGDLVLGAAISRVVDKIEISNNVANYRYAAAPGQLERDRSPNDILLGVSPSRPIPLVEIAVGQIGGLSGFFQGRGLAVNQGFSQSLVALSQVPVQVQDQRGDAQGLLLKLLGFQSTADQYTELWFNRLSFLAVSSFANREQDSTDKLFFGNSSAGYFTTTTTSTSQTLADGETTGSVDGIFRFAVNGSFTKNNQACSPSPCTAIYTARRFAEDDRFAQIIQIEVAGTPGWESPITKESINQLIRIFPLSPYAATVSSNGRAGGISVSGELIARNDTLFGAGPVSNLTGYSPALITEGGIPYNNQSASGDFSRIPFGGAGAAYTLGRALVSGAPLPNSLSDPPVPGTRVVIFDGPLQTQAGGARSDASAGVFLPQVGGFPGRNNSTTTFAAINSQPGAANGATTSASSAGLVGTTGIAGTGAASGPPPDTGFVALVPNTSAERNAQDAAQSAVLNDVTISSVANVASVELGQRPAAQADFGRGGGIAGAAPNIFKRSYRVATSPDAVTCAPEVIDTGSGSAGGTSSGDGSSPPAARVCKP